MEFFLKSQALAEAHKTVGFARYHLHAKFVEEIDGIWSIELLEPQKSYKEKDVVWQDINAEVENFFTMEKKDIKNLTVVKLYLLVKLSLENRLFLYSLDIKFLISFLFLHQDQKLNSVYICHAEENGDIWLQFMSSLVHRLSDMGTTEDLQKLRTSDTINEVRRQLSEGGKIFVAAYTDGKLYRVLVLGFSETKGHVRKK